MGGPVRNAVPGPENVDRNSLRRRPMDRGTGRNLIHRMVIAALRKRSISLISSREFDPLRRERGEDWPVIGFTMVGVKRLDNIHDCIARVIADKVAGDFVECGVWRGGASIFVRAAFDVYGATDRTVWLAASFEGMPKLTSAADKIDQDFSDHDYLAVPLDQVKDNFRKFDLPGDNVKFIKGWFSDRSLRGAGRADRCSSP
jgi:macrocin-O-methyltransferase TylF-like protien